MLQNHLSSNDAEFLNQDIVKKNEINSHYCIHSAYYTVRVMCPRFRRIPWLIKDLSSAPFQQFLVFFCNLILTFCFPNCIKHYNNWFRPNKVFIAPEIQYKQVTTGGLKVLCHWILHATMAMIATLFLCPFLLCAKHCAWFVA